jgi:hypothetical protein
MKIHRLIIVLTVVFIGLSSQPTQAMSSEAEAKFKIIMDMSLDQLGQTSSEVLGEMHPNTDWASYNFPDYIYDDKATETAYKVAVKNRSLLGTVNVSDEEIIIPCYCTCDSFGHDNLLYCFYKNGDMKDGFDEHGAQCAVCIRQALLAFLWSDLGATHKEIMVGMKEKFAPLIEKYHQHEH